MQRIFLSDMSVRVQSLRRIPNVPRGSLKIATVILFCGNYAVDKMTAFRATVHKAHVSIAALIDRGERGPSNVSFLRKHRRMIRRR